MPLQWFHLPIESPIVSLHHISAIPHYDQHHHYTALDLLAAHLLDAPKVSGNCLQLASQSNTSLECII